MEIDEHLKYTLYVTASLPFNFTFTNVLSLAAYNSILAREPVSRWYRDGRLIISFKCRSLIDRPNPLNFSVMTCEPLCLFLSGQNSPMKLTGSDPGE
jgi:hypothetical protein